MLAVDDNLKMFDLMEEIDSLIQYQETHTQANGTMFEDNLNQIQEQPIQYQEIQTLANGTISLQNPITITIEPKTLQDLGINEVLVQPSNLVENVPVR